MSAETERVNKRILSLLQSPSNSLVDITIRPPRDFNPNFLYFNVPTWCPVDASPKGEPQFVGIHGCLLFTVRRPSWAHTIIQIGKHLPSFAPFGPITWLGKVRTVPTELRGTGKHGICYHLPFSIWPPPASFTEMLGKRLKNTLHTSAIIHEVFVTTGNFQYYIMEVPGIRRDGILPSYFQVEKK